MTWVLKLENLEDGLDDCTFFKIKTYGKLEYLLNKVPSSQIHYNARNTDQFKTNYSRSDIFKNFFSLHNN